jgi:hypothetical protein
MEDTVCTRSSAPDCQLIEGWRGLTRPN